MTTSTLEPHDNLPPSVRGQISESNTRASSIDVVSDDNVSSTTSETQPTQRSPDAIKISNVQRTTLHWKRPGPAPEQVIAPSGKNAADRLQPVNPDPEPSSSKDDRSSDNTNSDPLQVPASEYPWLYMTSTLEACFQAPGETALKLKEGADASERKIGFSEELPGSDEFAKAAPALMQTFHAHGDACAKVESDALELATRSSPDAGTSAPLQPYKDVLETLERLQSEALNLQTSIVELTASVEKESSEPADIPWARQRIMGAISACLPVIKTRVSNLAMAQELVETAQENASLGLRMESLGL